MSVLDKIFKSGRDIPHQEITPYYRLLETVDGLPVPMRNDFVMRLIDYLTRDCGTGKPIIYLDAQRHYLYIARNVLLALLPFGPTYAHSFVEKLIAVDLGGQFDFYECIKCISEFLMITRGLVPEKESEWIAEAIGHLDTFSEQENKAELPEDFFLMRALSMVRLARELIVYRPEQALRSAQRVLQLTEYSGRRFRLASAYFCSSFLDTGLYAGRNSRKATASFAGNKNYASAMRPLSIANIQRVGGTKKNNCCSNRKIRSKKY